MMSGDVEEPNSAKRPSCRRARALGLVSLLAAITLAGFACQAPPSLDGNWGIPPQEPSGAALSNPVVILADNQLHNLYGDPVWLRSGFTNRLVPVAIRPVQLDFYGPAILRRIVTTANRNYRPVVHLGDALNAGCIWEWETFLPIMNETEMGWVMAPGNHDSYYFGNSGAGSEDEEWKRVCDTGDGKDGRMTKDRLVERYLRALEEQQILTLPPSLEADGVQRVSGANPGPFASGGEVAWRVEEVAWRIDRSRPWRSFVVQRLNVSHSRSPRQVVVVLLDTSQYERSPTLVPLWFITRNAGLNGELRADQIGVVDGWLKKENVNLLMGHHPYGILTSRGTRTIDRWRRERGVALYISAHTHKAQWFLHEGSAEAGENENWLELNVGSTTDWSPEFRTLAVLEAEARNKVGIRTQRTVVATKGATDCEERWEVPPGGQYDYIRYRDMTTTDPVRTQIRLMNALLATHDWALKNIPSSTGNKEWPPGLVSDQMVRDKILETMDSSALEAKVKLARQLRDFEAKRTVANATDQERFQFCQAMWASKYDLDGARAPGVDDAYLTVPTPKE